MSHDAPPPPRPRIIAVLTSYGVCGANLGQVVLYDDATHKIFCPREVAARSLALLRQSQEATAKPAAS